MGFPLHNGCQAVGLLRVDLSPRRSAYGNEVWEVVTDRGIADTPVQEQPARNGRSNQSSSFIAGTRFDGRHERSCSPDRRLLRTRPRHDIRSPSQFAVTTAKPGGHVWSDKKLSALRPSTSLQLGVMPSTTLQTITAVAIAGSLIGCTPSAEVLARKYARAPDAYAALLDHARADLGNRMCIVVGGDNIAEALGEGDWRTFWKNHDGSWYLSDQYEAKLELGTVLRAVGLTDSRYQAYMEFLERAGGEWLTYCYRRPSGIDARVLVFRSGLAVSGCNAQMEYADRVLPVDPSGSEIVHVVEAGDGWRLVLDCT